MRAQLLDIAKGVADVFFPPTCLHCGEIVEEESPLRNVCLRCGREIRRVEAPFCSCCGHPFYGDVDGERICPHCEGLHPVFGGGRTAVLFKGPARALILELKYRRGLRVLGDIRSIFSTSDPVLTWVRGATLVPVPLHPRKLRERGYNQTQLIAEALARAAGCDTRVKTLLRRVIDTPSQTAFDRRARLSNLRGAFAVARGVAVERGRRYVLVDDVFTTGSTLNRCAQALRDAGADMIDVVTFAHG